MADMGRSKRARSMPSRHGKRERKGEGCNSKPLNRNAKSEQHDTFICRDFPSRHEVQLEASVVQGKNSIRCIEHLSSKESSVRALQTEHGELYRNTTPQDRARSVSDQASGRTAAQVFLSPPPPVLSLHTYLQQHLKDRTTVIPADAACDMLIEQLQEVERSLVSNDDAQQVAKLQTTNADTALEVKDVTISSILENRLGADEIRQLDGGRFSTYAPGEPSDTLYIKNLSPDVAEQDLVAIFIRYQRPGHHLLFRLMQSGRMKGQAFVTFPDVVTATDALQLVNGYKLRDRPMIVEFGRQRHPAVKVESEERHLDTC